jgi:hypothetical protein
MEQLILTLKIQLPEEPALMAEVATLLTILSQVWQVMGYRQP